VPDAVSFEDELSARVKIVTEHENEVSFPRLVCASRVSMESVPSKERASIVCAVDLPEVAESARTLFETLPLKVVCSLSKVEALPAFVDTVRALVEPLILPDDGFPTHIETLLVMVLSVPEKMAALPGVVLRIPLNEEALP
jgi:hypothetical protein